MHYACLDRKSKPGPVRRKVLGGAAHPQDGHTAGVKQAGQMHGDSPMGFTDDRLPPHRSSGGVFAAARCGQAFGSAVSVWDVSVPVPAPVSCSSFLQPDNVHATIIPIKISQTIVRRAFFIWLTSSKSGYHLHRVWCPYIISYHEVHSAASLRSAAAKKLLAQKSRINPCEYWRYNDRP